MVNLCQQHMSADKKTDLPKQIGLFKFATHIGTVVDRYLIERWKKLDEADAVSPPSYQNHSPTKVCYLVY